MATLYKQGKENMPALKGKIVGDLVTALKAALITGYNDKGHEGWELVYESLTNINDTTKRIAVRSRHIRSEQKIFEIIDETSTRARLKCWNEWQDYSGVELLMESYINKNTSWANSIEIIANSHFVFINANAVINCFGDIFPFDSTLEQTVISKGSTSAGRSKTLATMSYLSTTLRTISGKELVLRSFFDGKMGFSANKGWQGALIGDAYIGGDTSISGERGGESSVYKAEMLSVNSEKYKSYAMLPLLCYTDNPISMDQQIIVIDGANKTIETSLTEFAGRLCFLTEM